MGKSDYSIIMGKSDCGKVLYKILAYLLDSPTVSIVVGYQLARAVRDLHLRLEYLAATTSSLAASKLVGEEALETFRNVVARLFEIEGF